MSIFGDLYLSSTNSGISTPLGSSIDSQFTDYGDLRPLVIQVFFLRKLIFNGLHFFGGGRGWSWSLAGGRATVVSVGPEAKTHSTHFIAGKVQKTRICCTSRRTVSWVHLSKNVDIYMFKTRGQSIIYFKYMYRFGNTDTRKASLLLGEV